MQRLNRRLLGDYARGGRGGDFRHAAERAPLDLELKVLSLKLLMKLGVNRSFIAFRIQARKWQLPCNVGC